MRVSERAVLHKSIGETGTKENRGVCAMADFFSKLHHFVVEITLLVLLLIAAFKLIRAEWPW